jgi:hypothetical protein
MQADSDPTLFNVSFDGRYSSVTYGARHKLGQSCSQAVGVACEATTDQKQVIGISFLNKLCSTGLHLKEKGINVSCPGGHVGKCTANIYS